MTERLVTLLHEEADGITVPRPPTAELLAGGRRLRRRRRATAVVAGCAAVLVVGAGAMAVQDTSRDTRVIDPKILQQIWEDFAPYRTAAGGDARLR